MTIFQKIALQGIRQNKSRTLVTIIGVILSSALITAIATFAVSLQSYMVNGSIQKYGDWHIEYMNVPSSFVQKQKGDKRVERVISFQNIGYAMLEGGTNQYKPYAFIAGFNDEISHKLPIHLLSGRMPRTSDEIMIPAHLATNGGIKYSVGDSITFSIGQRYLGKKQLSQRNAYQAGKSKKEQLVRIAEKRYTIVGFFQRPAFEAHAAPGYTMITKADDALSGNSRTAFVTLKDPYQLHSYKKNAKGGGSMLNDNVLRFMGLSEDHTFNMMLYSVGSILVLLIVIGSVFMIYNAFHISLNERTHQFGIFMSVGATEKQLRGSVLFEGFCIGIAGIPMGILIALPSIRLILAIVEKNFTNVLYHNVALEIEISPLILAIAGIISMITILISAYIPAKKAARTPVMECIRQTGEIKIEAGAVKTSKLAEHMYGLEGILAMKNFRRNKGRYRSIVLSLTFSVVLFVSCSAFGLYIQQETEQSIVDVDYDISLSTKYMKEKEFFMLYESLKEIEGIYDGSVRTADSGKPPTREMTFRSRNPEQSRTQMKEMIDGSGITVSYSLVNYHELLEQNRNMLFIVNLFTIVFSGMIALIAVANVFNTISTNIKLRRRELAMIRSVGMSDRDFNKMMGFECIFYGMRTLLFSLPLSVLFSYVIYMGISGGSADGITFDLPWVSIAVSLCGVFLIIFITTLYTVSQIKKENIIDALRDDMA